MGSFIGCSSLFLNFGKSECLDSVSFRSAFMIFSKFHKLHRRDLMPWENQLIEVSRFHVIVKILESLARLKSAFFFFKFLGKFFYKKYLEII